jgi:preprotein translocase subunit SecD
MVTATKVFNTYLLFLFFLLVATGCQSPEKKARERLSVLNVHLESRDLPEREKRVSVYRERPFTLAVQNEPFITQNDIQEARIVEVVGGFAIRLQFAQRGTRMLEQYSSGNPGKHLAIFSQFVTPPKETLNEGRWLAAPRINHRITDGVLVFTPDASREEAEQIVLGLNNVVRKLKKERWLPEN